VIVKNDMNATKGKITFDLPKNSMNLIRRGIFLNLSYDKIRTRPDTNTIDEYIKIIQKLVNGPALRSRLNAIIKALSEFTRAYRGEVKRCSK
jgi:hypothetical protein